MSIPTLVNLNNPNALNQQDIDIIYSIFKNDFIDNNTFLINGSISFLIDVDISNTCTCPNGNTDKQKTFWHIITKKINSNKPKNNPCLDDSEKNRTYCTYRAKRMPWIKYTIDNWNNASIVDHYYAENGRKLILWLKFRDFLVILKKIDGTTNKFLVSSYIIYSHELNNFRRKLKKYNDNKPTGEEWF